MQLFESDDYKIYIKVLQKMSPEKKLLKTFELTDFAKKLFLAGLKERFPELDNKEIKKIYSERISRCHNRNY